jgi:ribosomal protein L34E
MTEKKNGLTYLSWASAWGEVKKLYPDATYIIYENKDGLLYHTDGKTCWVKTGVTINGIEHIEYLPVMDYKNKSIPIDQVTSFDANKAIQRSLTKAIARHGLGLYIYAGEDLPEDFEPDKPKKQFDNPIPQPTVDQFNSQINKDPEQSYMCMKCGGEITPIGTKLPKELAAYTTKKYGMALCSKCASEKAKQNEKQAAKAD